MSNQTGTFRRLTRLSLSIKDKAVNDADKYFIGLLEEKSTHIT